MTRLLSNTAWIKKETKQLLKEIQDLNIHPHILLMHFITRMFFLKEPVYKKQEAGALSVLNFLVSEKLRSLFLK